jgi:spermidine synthase
LAGKGIRVLAERSSPYAELKVVDVRVPGEIPMRLMFIGLAAQTVQFLEEAPGRRPNYIDAIDLIEAFHPDPRRFLVIGMGGGTLTGRLRDRPSTERVDVVEIDADVVDLAREYFDFHDDGPVRLHVMDARYHARRIAARGDYDLIFFDAFGAGTAPFHLFSVEALEEFRVLLAEGGTFVMNYLGFSEPGHRVGLHSAVRTIDEVFPHRRVLLGERPGRKRNGFANFLILGSDTPLALRRSPFEGLDDPARRGRAAQLIAIQGDPGGDPDAQELEAIAASSRDDLDRRLRIEIDPDEGVLVTDDRNGLDLANVEQNDALRAIVFSSFRRVFVHE